MFVYVFIIADKAETVKLEFLPVNNRYRYLLCLWDNYTELQETRQDHKFLLDNSTSTMLQFGASTTYRGLKYV